ncbi:MAG: hydroxymethylbilane synthase [Planctomycetota bacterium]
MKGLLRLGTRGSDLAMTQSGLVAKMLAEQTQLKIELVVITTTGDREQGAADGQASWSMGAFVGELERALLDGNVDLAVHSYKDMATAITPGLVVAAVPERASPHDVLVFESAEQMKLAADALHGVGEVSDLVIGTSSPRRQAQLNRALGCKLRAIRGNVPTRLDRLGATGESDRIDAVCLAAAGLDRLGITPKHMITLDIDRFPTAAAQGALAVQTRDDTELIHQVSSIEDTESRATAECERAFLRKIQAGCHTAVGAHATKADNQIRLYAEYFSETGEMLCIEETGLDADSVGRKAGQKVLDWK